MFSVVLSWLGNLFGGPFAKAAVDAYRAKLAAENTSEKIAADLAARELSVEQRERELAAEMLIARAGALVHGIAAAAVCRRIYNLRLESGGLGQGPGPRHDRCTLRRYVAMGDGGGHRIFRWTHSRKSRAGFCEEIAPACHIPLPFCRIGGKRG